MKLNSHVVIFLMVSTIVFSSFAMGENLLSNPSFEVLQQDNTPQGWQTQTWRGQGEFSIDSKGRTGKTCIKIYSTEGADCAWRQRVSVPEFAHIRLSAWVKTENITTDRGQGVLINCSDADDARTQVLTGTNDWTKLECEFYSMGVREIQINCLFGGWGQAKGTAWFDDVSLEILDEKRPEPKNIAAEIKIDPAATQEPISKYIYGQFIEHLGQCIYGGIWAEMLEDRKFYFPVPAEGEIWRTTNAQARVLRASPWRVVGPENAVTMTTENPLSGDHAPQITVDGSPAGIYQEELALVSGKEYTGYIILRSNERPKPLQSLLGGHKNLGPVQVSLIWGQGENERQTITINMPLKRYRKYNLKFKSGMNTDNARLEILANGKGSLIIGTVSLMPADNVKGFRKDTLALLKELDSPVYRWPGGNFVSGYDWRDGLGDRDHRPTRTNPAWTGIETNDVGMHEFIKLCELIDAEPMIAVNTGFGDAYSAAAEVEYANGALNTPMGKLRAKNGNRKAFKVKWWCVGNEMFGDWQLGYMRLSHYVLKHNQVEEMMRKVDPTIKTVGVGDTGRDWSKGMLENCADHMDLISEHFYTQSRSDLTAHVRQVPDQIKRKAELHRQYRGDIPGLAEKDIRIAMDEWNYWYGPHIFGELGTRYFMRDGLGIAAGLHEYFRNSDIYFMANYAQTVNVIGCIKTTKTEAFLDATAYPLILYRHQFGTLPLKVSGWSEKLDAAAALTDDKKTLTIGLVNSTWDNYEVKLDIGALTPEGKASCQVISADSPVAYNDPGQELIKIVSTEPVDIAKSVSIKPISITLIKVPLK